MEREATSELLSPLLYENFLANEAFKNSIVPFAEIKSSASWQQSSANLSIGSDMLATALALQARLSWRRMLAQTTSFSV